MPSLSPISFDDFLIKKNWTEKEVLEWRAIPPGLYTHLPPISKLPRITFPRPDLGKGVEDVMYAPTRIQRLFHNTQKENCLLEGPRGTGKSVAIRMDAHMWAKAIPGWKYLVLRRKLVDLKKNHLLYMKSEMKKLGGTFNQQDNIAYYDNGSVGFFSYCMKLADVENLLSSDFGAIYFDEWTTFPWDMTTRIAGSARLPEELEEELGVKAFVKGGTNPIGIGSTKVKQYFIDKKVPVADDPEYNPEDWEAIRTTRADNPYLNWKAYEKRLSRQPERVRLAWRDGIWTNEGAYFLEWRPFLDSGKPWHVIKKMPLVRDGDVYVPAHLASWVNIFRVFDWGFRPDPAVCIWLVVLSKHHVIAFKERTWRETLARDVARDIKRESVGMKIVDTFADPSIFAKKDGQEFSVADSMEGEGIYMTPSINDRTLWGDAICNFLNDIMEDGEGDQHPKLQVLSEDNEYRGNLGCPELIRTIPEMLTDPSNSRKIAEGDDHYVAALAYFCIGDTPPSRDPEKPARPRWMMSRREFARSFTSRV